MDIQCRALVDVSSTQARERFRLEQKYYDTHNTSVCIVVNYNNYIENKGMLSRRRKAPSYGNSVIRRNWRIVLPISIITYRCIVSQGVERNIGSNCLCVQVCYYRTMSQIMRDRTSSLLLEVVTNRNTDMCVRPLDEYYVPESPLFSRSLFDSDVPRQPLIIHLVTAWTMSKWRQECFQLVSRLKKRMTAE